MKKQNKKSQIAGQILIYILAIIIFSLTLLYGYKAIDYFNERSTEISYLQLENEIKNEVEKVKGDTMGTIKKRELRIPGNYKHVCFVKSIDGFLKNPATITTDYDLIKDHIESKVGDTNMFLAPPGDISLDIGQIDVLGNFQCIEIIGGKITLKIESMGNHVKISEWV
jgi:hypothetical protein